MVSPAVAPQLESSRSVASLEFACEGRVFSNGAGGDELWFPCLWRAEKGATRKQMTVLSLINLHVHFSLTKL